MRHATTCDLLFTTEAQRSRSITEKKFILFIKYKYLSP